MQFDEGYVKFDPQWTYAPPLAPEAVEALNYWRQKVYELGLIGVYPNGIGYGNISCRYQDSKQFIISGTATGKIPYLTPEHYTLVTRVDAPGNKLWCKGPVLASSESMSHAAVYEYCPEVTGVIHVHHMEMWQRLLHQVPTTDASALYGSPEMVHAIHQLFETTSLRDIRIFVMEGHPEGVFVFGHTLEAAVELLLGQLSAGR
jgi:L-ribulose-5-phosphate 4-epimerase